MAILPELRLALAYNAVSVVHMSNGDNGSEIYLLYNEMCATNVLEDKFWAKNKVF